MNRLRVAMMTMVMFGTMLAPAIVRASTCGDGIIEELEQCDDSNTTDGDGCSSTCQDEPVCGNGTIEAGEQCDDSNTTDGDGCSSVCAEETIMGPLIDATQYDDILTAGFESAGGLFHNLIGPTLVISFSLALLAYFTKWAIFYVRDDKRE